MHIQPQQPTFPPVRVKLSFEERLDRNRKRMTLRQAADSMLPPCMVLLTDQPIQAVHHGLMQRIFTLGFLDENSKLFTRHVEYLLKVPDDIQLRWAMDDFSAVLGLAGFDVSSGRAHA